MGQRAITSMTADEFFAWQEMQDELYELVDGMPLQMMSGTENRHDDVTVNLIAEVRNKLRGKPCKPTTQDTGIKISEGQIRRPDMTIKCGPSREKTFVALDPRAVFEVMSPSTRGFDQSKKLEEYKSVESLSHIVLIDPDSPELIAYQRDASRAWVARMFSGLAAEVEFADLGFSLSLAEIYQDVIFRAKLVLVMEE